MHVTFVDICWTLFSSNTTYDFCRWAARSHGGSAVGMPSAFARKLNVAAYRLTGVDYLRRMLLHNLKGMTRDEIDELANRFCTEYLAGRKVDEVWQLLPPHDEVILLSSTLDVIASAVSASFGFGRHLSSRLAFDNNGICLGSIEYDAAGRKQELLDGVVGAYSIFTDNLSDLELIAGSDHAVVVVYGNEGRWSKALQRAGVDINKIKFVYARTTRY